ncbi:hypothetical protein [Corynebacterium hiratae]|uniref:Uncharacterized protein n=1 Tax=Corynebacterium hiratae TaxID=3139423 RepID=A0A553FYU4_9CORY|nr:hypothetical protein [Corynebacterium aurimucosum]TRX62416.1 hypothetical protein FNY97_05450 [Corynebacterium aurimucosum]
MTEPTRKQIYDAHEALHELGKWASTHYDMTDDRIYLTQVETVLMGMPPKPPLSMGEIAWDDNEHRMAGAKHQYFDIGVMLYRGTDGNILFMHDGKVSSVDPWHLLPTGKRYTLTEVQE